MKMRLLPEIDLARIALLPRDQKYRELERMAIGHPPYSYKPVRDKFLDILNVTPGSMLAPLPRTPWEVIESSIRRCAKLGDEQKANLAVAKGLYDYVTDHGITGRSHDFLALSLGIADKVRYWSPVVLNIGGRAVIPFFDPRRRKLLSKEGRRFVFSVMHERIRVADPDFARVGLAIFQFSPSEVRVPRAHFDDGIALVPFGELEAAILETYSIWLEVLMGRETEMRQRGSGTTGTLL